MGHLPTDPTHTDSIHSLIYNTDTAQSNPLTPPLMQLVKESLPWRKWWKGQNVSTKCVKFSTSREKVQEEEQQQSEEEAEEGENVLRT